MAAHCPEEYRYSHRTVVSSQPIFQVDAMGTRRRSALLQVLFQPMNCHWHPATELCLTDSEDGGRTWSSPRVFLGGYQDPNLTRLRDGALIHCNCRPDLGVPRPDRGGSHRAFPIRLTVEHRAPPPPTPLPSRSATGPSPPEHPPQSHTTTGTEHRRESRLHNSGIRDADTASLHTGHWNTLSSSAIGAVVVDRRRSWTPTTTDQDHDVRLLSPSFPGWTLAVHPTRSTS